MKPCRPVTPHVCNYACKSRPFISFCIYIYIHTIYFAYISHTKDSSVKYSWIRLKIFANAIVIVGSMVTVLEFVRIILIHTYTI